MENNNKPAEQSINDVSTPVSPAQKPIVINPDISPPSASLSNSQPATPNSEHPTTNATPLINSNPAQVPGHVVGSSESVTPTSQGTHVSTMPGLDQPTKGSKKKAIWKKPIFFAPLIVLLLLGGSAAAYYGYWLNPSVIWSQSLSDTNTAYNKIVNSINSEANYKGYSVNGNVTVKNGGTSYTGTLTNQSDGSNTSTSVKANVGITNLDIELRSIKVTGSSVPDLYVQLNGINNLGLGSLLGLSSSAVNSLNGQWIEISHTILQNALSAAQKLAGDTSSQTGSTLTKADLIAAAKAIGQVNSQYIFTSNKSKGVLYVMKDYGFETINGTKTYHYKVGFVKQNVKDYIQALYNSLNQTALATWISKETGRPFSDIFNVSSLQNSANSINSSDYIDVWSGVNSRLIYKVRVSDQSNPATNYLDIGLNYKSGSPNLPYFINYVDGSGSSAATISLNSTINTKLNTINSLLSYASGNVKVSGSLIFTPTNQPASISAPSSSISLQQAFNELGLSQYYNAIISELNAASTGQNSGQGLPVGNGFIGL